MLIECCSNERSYLRYYGLMGQVHTHHTPHDPIHDALLYLTPPPPTHPRSASA